MTGFTSPNYTQAPNDLFDSLMQDMSESELKVVLAAIRQTFGYHKHRDAISLTQFEKMTGLSRQSVANGIEAAINRGVLKIAGEGKRGVRIFELVVISDQSINATSTIQDFGIDEALSIPKSRHTKEKDSKETSQKIKDSAPNGAGASKSTKHKASENPEQAKAIVALIEAWLTHSGTIQPTAYKNKTMRAEAAAMLVEGITPKHIEAYIKSLRLQDFWKDKAITWRKLAGEIKGFVHARPVIVSENPPAPVQERATPETVISLEEQAAARALFEQLVQSKVANDG